MTMKTETKTYIQETDNYGIEILIPVESYKWTGRWKLETIDGDTRLYIERQVRFLGIPLSKTWVYENRFVFHEECTTVFDCNNEIVN